MTVVTARWVHTAGSGLPDAAVAASTIRAIVASAAIAGFNRVHPERTATTFLKRAPFGSGVGGRLRSSALKSLDSKSGVNLSLIADWSVLGL
jgi:hypothetical protein